MSYENKLSFLTENRPMINRRPRALLTVIPLQTASLSTFVISLLLHTRGAFIFVCSTLEAYRKKKAVDNFDTV